MKLTSMQGRELSQYLKKVVGVSVLEVPKVITSIVKILSQPQQEIKDYCTNCEYCENGEKHDAIAIYPCHEYDEHRDYCLKRGFDLCEHTITKDAVTSREVELPPQLDLNEYTQEASATVLLIMKHQNQLIKYLQSKDI